MNNFNAEMKWKTFLFLCTRGNCWPQPSAEISEGSRENLNHIFILKRLHVKGQKLILTLAKFGLC